ncbi:hypothetical protein HYDPIDRAFT_104630 [Hydnomerulius pinastri MD-312]|nr:hypothetical protein HYDPIDRAFT_104630 [Hydnomerulius pinastri MD-312]
MISAEEYSQAPPSSAQTSSQQPSPEFLASLGIKVRDFAYESTLPAITPVPRFPRQVQPAPRPLKRSRREWDGEAEEPLSSGSVYAPSGSQSLSTRTPPKKSRSLERKATEPIEKAEIQHTRTLERIAIGQMRSLITPPIQPTVLPVTPSKRFSASPPTSPITPQLSQFASQESELVQTPFESPFRIHVDDTSMIPASQLDTESQALAIHPISYSQLELSPQPLPCPSSPGFPSNPPSPRRAASPSQSADPSLEPPPIKAIRRGRKHRDSNGEVMDTAPSPNRYELRRRPILPSHTPTRSRHAHQPYPVMPSVKQSPGPTSKSLPRRNRERLR